MGRRFRPAARLASGTFLLALLVALAHVRLSDPLEGAVLRVAVRTTAGTSLRCRRLDDAELAALPPHMRRAEVCETRATPYRLRVTVNDARRLDRVYRAAGLRGDRPLTIDEAFAMTPGRHRVRVRLAPTEGEGASGPPAYTFDAPVELPEGRVRLLALDGEAAAFTLR